MDHRIIDNTLSLTTMPMGKKGYEAKYNYTDHIRTTEYHCHDFYEFYIHLHGGQYFGLDDHLYMLEPNQLFIIPPFSMHGISSVSEMINYERAYINISPEVLKILGCGQIDLDQFFRSYTSRGEHCFQLTEQMSVQCVSQIRRLQESETSGKPLAGFQNYAVLMNFLVTVCDSLYNSKCVTSNVNSNSIIRDVLTYINNNYTQSLNMESLAKQFGISVSFLSHEFVRFTNRSVYDYILYRRVMLAKQMIQTDLTLNTIAYQCGFNDYSNFLRIFKKLVGLSPSDYRKTLKKFR